jgi:hypothetical protein
MTAQIHELLTEKGKSLTLACCPPLPDGHPRLRSRAPEIGSPLYSTACIRGYRGHWLLQGGRLYLVGLEGIWELLPGEPLFADWFSGELRIPLGAVLQYLHIGFASVYERERLVDIDRGVVVAERELDRRKEPPESWTQLPSGSRSS